jgi:probable addiction module antidote protein
MARAKKVKEVERITFSRFDAAEYLKSEKDMVLFLEAAMEEAADDPAYIAEAIGTIARAA